MNPPQKRVVVTGLGSVSCYGLGVDVLWDSLLSATSIIENIPKDWSGWTEFNSDIISPLPDINYQVQGFKKTDIRQFDPVSLQTLLSGTEALLSAGLISDPDENRINFYYPSDISVVVGTTLGGGESLLDHMAAFYKIENERSSRFNFLTVPRFMSNAPCVSVALKYGVNGPCYSTATACASGTTAIGQSFNNIRNGLCRMAICGGSERLDSGGLAFKGFDLSGTLVQNTADKHLACRPFDRDRSGFLLSEGGSACLILEEYDAAVQRNAPILAELVAYSESFEAFSVAKPEPSGKAVTNNIETIEGMADISFKEVDYINSHGTGTIVNDEIEAKVFSSCAGKNTLINSTKSIMGHTLGASGAFEAIVATQSISHQRTHISKNITSPIADLNFVKEVDKADINYAYTHSLAFGGHIAGLLFKSPD